MFQKVTLSSSERPPSAAGNSAPNWLPCRCRSVRAKSIASMLPSAFFAWRVVGTRRVAEVHEDGELASPTDAELETDEALHQYMFREVTTSQHISCTAKMGPADDPMAVVSQHGRVHGLEGLRVADASI